MTCYVESPEAIGWRRYRFMDVSIAVPPGYTVSTTSRSLRARNGKGGLTIRATSDLLPPQLRARPARATTEAACESRVAGYPGTISASYNDGEFWVMAEWFGTSFWADGDWPKKLVAVINATRLEDAALLRTALHTVRAERMAR